MDVIDLDQPEVPPEAPPKVPSGGLTWGDLLGLMLGAGLLALSFFSTQEFHFGDEAEPLILKPWDLYSSAATMYLAGVFGALLAAAANAVPALRAPSTTRSVITRLAVAFTFISAWSAFWGVASTWQLDSPFADFTTAFWLTLTVTILLALVVLAGPYVPGLRAPLKATAAVVPLATEEAEPPAKPTLPPTYFATPEPGFTAFWVSVPDDRRLLTPEGGPLEPPLLLEPGAWHLAVGKRGEHALLVSTAEGRTGLLVDVSGVRTG